MASKLKITQVRSAIRQTKRQKRTLEALGLRRMHQTVVHNDTPQIRGMVNRVSHLVTMEPEAADRPARKKTAQKAAVVAKTETDQVSTTAEEPPAKKTAAKKTAAKKSAAKKSATKKTAAKKSASKKTAAKKSASKKTAAKKSASKKTAGGKKQDSGE